MSRCRGLGVATPLFLNDPPGSLPFKHMGVPPIKHGYASNTQTHGADLLLYHSGSSLAALTGRMAVRSCQSVTEEKILMITTTQAMLALTLGAAAFTIHYAAPFISLLSNITL